MNDVTLWIIYCLLYFLRYFESRMIIFIYFFMPFTSWMFSNSFELFRNFVLLLLIFNLNVMANFYKASIIYSKSYWLLKCIAMSSANASRVCVYFIKDSFTLKCDVYESIKELWRYAASLEDFCVCLNSYFFVL